MSRAQFCTNRLRQQLMMLRSTLNALHLPTSDVCLRDGYLELVLDPETVLTTRIDASKLTTIIGALFDIPRQAPDAQERALKVLGLHQ